MKERFTKPTTLGLTAAVLLSLFAGQAMARPLDTTMNG